MARQRKNGQYWDVEEDNLLHIYFFSGSTALQKTRALNEVLPKLRMCARIVKERYYSKVNQPDLIEDSICYFLLHSKFDESKGSYFSYISNSFKHYFHDIFVTQKSLVTKAHNFVDDNYDIGESEWIAENYHEKPDFDEFDLKGREAKLNIILSHLRHLLQKTENKIKTYSRRAVHYDKYLKMAIIEKKYILACIEYFTKYYLDGEVSGAGLTDYIKSNYNMSPFNMMQLNIKIFGFSSNNKNDDAESKNENRWQAQGRTYFQDDYCPTQLKRNRADKRYKKKIGNNTTEFEYF